MIRIPAAGAAALLTASLVVGGVGVGSHAAAGHPSSGTPHPATGSVPNRRLELHNAHGVHVGRVQRIGKRQVEATITPTALGRPLGVRIILPRGYRPDPDHRYPTLYLFPGTSGHSWDWSRSGGAPKTTSAYRLITVTSDIGFNGDGGSWFSNWVDRHTSLGKSQWERYNVHQLIPWVDANLATIRARHGRAVAGLSQGGYGATELAARHPDLFTEMGSFSGAPEIDRDPDVRVGAAAVIDATMSGLNQVEPNAPFGDHVSDEINWQGHDPAQYVDNLRGIGLWFATADGAPGKYDDPVTNPTGVAGAGAVESLTHVSTDAFISHLKSAHVPYIDYDYGQGTHSWPYWARDLRSFLPTLMHRFAHPVTPRKRFYYKGIQTHWSEFGWRVRLHRQQIAFTTLSHADRHGFHVTGIGRATVTTPRDFTPSHRYHVTIGSQHHSIQASKAGRLRVVVPLGTTADDVAVRIAS
jgi:S-formylglutathione hydrolase FrmB